MSASPHRPTETKTLWHYLCRCVVLFALLCLNLPPADAEVPPAIDARTTGQTQQTPPPDQKTIAAERPTDAMLHLNGEQLRSFKFFLAGCILSLLIVLICSLFRNTSASKTDLTIANPQHYPPQHYPPQHYPPQHFAPPTGLPPHTQGASSPPHTANASVQSMPYGMYYPSIPLSLSMPVAWPPGAHPTAHPGQPPEMDSNQNPAAYSTQSLDAHNEPTTPTQPNQVPLTQTESNGNSEKGGDTAGSPIAPAQKRRHSSAPDGDAGQQDATEPVSDSVDPEPHSVLDMRALKVENGAHRANRLYSTEEQPGTKSGAGYSPLLDEIINHTRHLKTLA